MQTTKHTNTTRTTKTTTSTWVSLLTKSLCCYNWGNANTGVFIFKLRDKSANLVHFIHHEFFTFHRSQNFVLGLLSNFVHFIHPYMNLLPFFTEHLRSLLLNKPRRSLWFILWRSDALVIYHKSILVIQYHVKLVN